MTSDEKYERRKKIADAIRQGRLMPEVAREFRVSCETVRRACYEHEVPVSALTVQPSNPATTAA